MNARAIALDALFDHLVDELLREALASPPIEARAIIPAPTPALPTHARRPLRSVQQRPAAPNVDR